MTGEEEFEAFVRQNRDLIERMIQLQKGAASEFIGAERAMASEMYGHARDFADYGRTRSEDLVRSAYSAFTDPEVQRHFMNMGMEFFMGMSALMQKAPMPGFVRDGISTTGSAFRASACRSNEDCGARNGPKKVDISIEDDVSRRDIPDDVFKGCDE